MCQKGCYPMAYVFFVNRDMFLSSREQGKTSRGASFAPPARAPLRSNTHDLFLGGRNFSCYGRAWRIEAIFSKLWATNRLSAKGFKVAFSCSNRRLVCGVTSALAKTRARGVWALP